MEKMKRISFVILISMLFVVMIQPAMASKGKVNINTATKKELVTLKHVGDKIADRIIEYRKGHPFQAPKDLMNVKGVGQKVYDANKNKIIVKEE